MKTSVVIFLLLVSTLGFATELGKWTAGDIDALLQGAQTLPDQGAKIDYISRHFLNTRYQPHTLIGSEKRPEQFTVRLDGLDCMTFIESVEALRRSGSFNDFRTSLKSVRYKKGVVEFKNRNHFFINWRESNKPHIIDVTQQVGGTASQQIIKQLNKASYKPLIPGIPVLDTTVSFIPGDRLDHTLLERLETGDYVGLYTNRAGLDVSHVGIVVKKDKQTFFRHASNEPNVNKVVDEDFLHFFKHRQGIVVLRVQPTRVNELL